MNPIVLTLALYAVCFLPVMTMVRAATKGAY